MAYLPRRFIVVFMLFIVMVILHSMRTNVAVANLKTIKRDESNNNNNNHNNTDPSANHLWTTREVAHVHFAFYFGYVAFQLPAAWTTTKLPSNRMLSLAIFFSCALNIIMPACTMGQKINLKRIIPLCSLISRDEV